MTLTRLTALAGLVSAALALQACIGVAANTSTLAVKSSKRDELRPLAEAGNAQAQFELGESFCCMGPGFDTGTATHWLCRAALQEHPGAMHELGRIYRGDVSRSPAPGQKLMKALRGQRSDRHAMMWMALAAEHGYTDAAESLAELEAQANPDDSEAAAVMRQDWRKQACEYQDVFPEDSSN